MGGAEKGCLLNSTLLHYTVGWAEPAKPNLQFLEILIFVESNKVRIKCQLVGVEFHLSQKYYFDPN